MHTCGFVLWEKAYTHDYCNNIHTIMHMVWAPAGEGRGSNISIYSQFLVVTTKQQTIIQHFLPIITNCIQEETRRCTLSLLALWLNRWLCVCGRIPLVRITFAYYQYTVIWLLCRLALTQSCPTMSCSSLCAILTTFFFSSCNSGQETLLCSHYCAATPTHSHWLVRITSWFRSVSGLPTIIKIKFKKVSDP